MKTNLSQLEKTSSNAAAATPNSTLQDNLRSLRLTYVLENAVQAAGNGSGHLQYLQELWGRNGRRASMLCWSAPSC